MEATRAHVFVSGKVQGVFYRANTRDTAREAGVDGWVKNLDDGRVEAVFEGPRTPSSRWSSGVTGAVRRPGSTTSTRPTRTPRASTGSRSDGS